MAAAVLVALVLSACGGGGSSSAGGTESASASGGASASSPKEAALKEGVSAAEMFVAGEGKQFCEQLTAKTRKEMLAETAKTFGGAPCAQIVGSMPEFLGPEAKMLGREVAKLGVADVTIHGTTATIEFAQATPETLEESGGHWYVTHGP